MPYMLNMGLFFCIFKMPYVSNIRLYPIKSLDGVEVEKATILSSGALKYDREYAMFDGQDSFVNGKRNTKIHLVRSHFSLKDRTVSLEIPGTSSSQSFHLDEDKQGIEAALSEYFGFAVKFQQNSVMGFPDDTDSPGPTVISRATLTEVASWFPNISLDEMRRRVRANIEIGGDIPPFWEDKLFAEAENNISCSMGEVRFLGINPCARCIVPTMDSLTGEAYANFQKIFVSKRKETLPEWVVSSRFNHFYRLTVNTRLPGSETGKILQIGDEVEIFSD
jgi:uncharacterized protein